MNVIEYNPWEPSVTTPPPPPQVWVTGPPSFMYSPVEMAAAKAYEAIAAYYEALTAALEQSTAGKEGT